MIDIFKHSMRSQSVRGNESRRNDGAPRFENPVFILFGELLLLMPEVMMLFFYTMAFRWCPCISLLFPNMSFVVRKEVPEIYIDFSFLNLERNILNLFCLIFIVLFVYCYYFFRSPNCDRCYLCGQGWEFKLHHQWHYYKRLLCSRVSYL